MTKKSPKQLERYFKGVANHYRIAILLLLLKEKELSLEEIRDSVEGNTKTISEHTHRLVRAGLVNKKYVGRMVAHSLSPYGKKLTNFIKSFQHS